MANLKPLEQISVSQYNNLLFFLVYRQTIFSCEVIFQNEAAVTNHKNLRYFTVRSKHLFVPSIFDTKLKNKI